MKKELKKTRIILEIKDCSGCPFHDVSPYPTNDSFERPHYWWCTHKDVEQKEKNESGGYAKKVAGYVEWHDDTPIPDWCPIVDHPDLKSEDSVIEPDEEQFPNVPPIDFTATDNNE